MGAPDTTLERGAALGRYLVLDKLGHGGMGVVYAAYDPQLERRVAIKLLRRDAGAAAAESRRVRLQREAQAMARLSHPNVITVHDVGTSGEQVFVAMEFVDGCTLKDWIAEAKRPWSEVLAAFLQAGRGLAAAHRAGLVHRDFKPDNVLVGKNGTIRVTDFGLARDLAPGGDEDAGDEDAPSGRSGGKLTETGMIMGTPAYMAPEQHRGRAADARADQFAFCVALYEGLYGEHPFQSPISETDTTLAAESPEVAIERDLSPADALALQVVEGRIRESPAKSEVPARIRRGLLRGLAVDPERRYPSMDALLDDLAANPGARQRRILAIGGLVVAAAAVVSWSFLRPPRAEPDVCAGAVARLGGVWDAATQEKMRAAFAASKLPYQEVSFRRTVAILDAYASQWTAMYGDACRATRVRKEQPEPLFDLQLACLERRRVELGETVAVLAAADAKVVERSVAAAIKLAPVEECANTEVLTARARPAAADSAALQVATSRLAKLKADYALGRYEAGLADARRLLPDAVAIGHAPLTAEVQLYLGKHARQMGEIDAGEAAYLEAIRLAGEGRDDLILIDALYELALLLANERDDYAGARRLAVTAQATLSRVAADPLRRGLVHNALGEVQWYMGRYAEAKQEYGTALDLYRRALGPENPKVLGMLNDLASVARKQGHPREALPLFAEALRMARALHGDEHPNVAAVLNNQGAALMESGDYDAALDSYLRSLAIKELLVGREHPNLSTTLHNIGNLLLEQDRYQEAETYYQRALDIREKAIPNSLFLANTLDGMGGVRRKQGRFDEALALHRRALAIKKKLVGEEHRELAITLVDLGEVFFDRGQIEDAQAQFEAAVAVHRKLPERDHPEFAQALRSLAEAWIARGRCDRAAPLLDEAAAVVDKTVGREHPDLRRIDVVRARCVQPAR